MAKPTLIPWDTNDINILEPDLGHQANGWAHNEKPTSTNHNWLFQNIMLWLAYLDANVIYGQFVQNIAAVTTVTVTHNLGRPHTVTVFDAANGFGVIIQPDTVTTGLNADVITFGVAQSGSILCL